MAHMDKKRKLLEETNGDVPATHERVPRLARRGELPPTTSQRRLIWDVLANLYDAESNPEGIVSLGVAENALMHKETVDFFRTAMADFSDFSLTYGDGPSGSKRLNTAMRHFLNRHLKPLKPIEEHELTITNGVSTSIEACAFVLADPADGFLLGRPYYGSFPSDLDTRAQVKTVDVSFGDVDPCGVEGVQCYEDALIDFENHNAGKVRALLLCHPHNPLGRCYSREALIGLMRLCQKYQIHFISDEIYALSIFDNPDAPDATPFISVLSMDLTDIIDPQLVHVLWGLSKDFGANGLRIGATISQHNPKAMEAIKSYGLFTYPAAPSDHLASKLLEDQAFTDYYIAENQRRLGDAYAFVTGFLKRHNIEYLEGANSAFFIWVNLGRSWGRKTGPVSEERKKNLTNEIMDKLLQHKVFLASGNAFGSERQGWLRIVFTQPRFMVEEGLRRMMKAIEDS